MSEKGANMSTDEELMISMRSAWATWIADEARLDAATDEDIEASS